METENGIRMVDEIAMRDVGELKANPRNSRTHSEAQVAAIAASIKRLGFRAPLLLDGEDVLIAGHGRLLAAARLGMKTVPTVDGSDMTAEERRAYMIADNQLALMAGWNEEILTAELRDLSANFDMDMTA